MKRLSFALAALGMAVIALPAVADNVNPTDSTLISVPQMPGGFILGVTGTYLQPSVSNGDLNYAVANTNNGSDTAFDSSVKSNDPGYDWGYGVNIGYVFANTGNDIQLSWNHFDNSFNAATSAPGNSNNNITPIFLPSNTNLTQANSNVKFDYNSVDLNAGQYINIGSRLETRVYAGLRYVDFSRDNNITFNQANLSPTSLRQGGK